MSIFLVVGNEELLTETKTFWLHDDAFVMGQGCDPEVFHSYD